MVVGTAVGIAVGLVGVYALSVGIWFGVFIHWHCSAFYKRSVDEEIIRAREKAYADHLAKLDDEARKAKENAQQELPQDRDEREDSFEQSLQTVFPNDPKIQDVLRKQRRDKEAIGGG